MTSTADEVVLRNVVGASTLMRGRDYAERGAVLNPKCSHNDGHIVGQVRGTARQPYTAVALVARGRDGGLTSFQGTCTCPFGSNCKHSVALVLATCPPSRAPKPVLVDRAPRAPWERLLSGVLEVDAPSAPLQAAVALQFDLVPPPVSSGRAGRSASARLGLRPVVPGKNGGWIRTGISWWDLDYGSYSRRHQVPPEHLQLLEEIRAMGSAGAQPYYGSQNAAIQLESIASKRIWDLLCEARALGLPLVQTGKLAHPVTLSREPAALVLDMSRNRKGLVVQPEVVVGEQRPSPEASLLLGNPAHVIAWWRCAGSGPTAPSPSLRLAAFATPIDDALRGLLHQRQLVIPRKDESRFFAGYYPVLRERVSFVSGNESVELPQPPPPELSLTVRHLDGHRLDLEWKWLYSFGDAIRQESIWPSPGARGRDLDHEDRVLHEVTAAAAAIPALFSVTDDDVPRLVPAATLDGIDTVRFAMDVLPRLAECPYLVVETVGTPSDYREAEADPVIAITGAESEDRDWFDLAVTISVDDEEVPFRALFVALTRGESHLILPSGTFFGLDCEQFRALAELIVEARAMQDSPNDDTVRLSRFQTSLWSELDKLGVISGQAAEWQRTVRGLADVTGLPELPAPQGLDAELRPYQLAGFNWLAFLHAHGLGGVLADEMGLGKTLQALALMCHVKEQSLADGPFLVVAPTSVVSNWASECQRFAPGLRVQAISETASRRGCELATLATEADVVVTSYTLFRLEHDDYAALDWAGLVLDEAQFVKNRQSIGYNCARKLQAPFKLAITGTPMENNLMELWSLLSITAPGLFASPVRFEKHYRWPIEKDKDAVRLAQFRRRLKPLMLRRTKEQVLPELPDKQEQVIELTLNPKHRRVYQTHLQRERQKVLGLLGDLEKNRFMIFRSLTLLRQACLDAALIDPAHANIPSTKLDLLMEQLTEITQEGHRTLVFSQFTRFLGAARRRLDAEGIDYCYLDGSTRNRAGVLREFKNGTAPVFLISLKAGGFGLNLTEADYCILLDPWWNPATEAQAVDRLHRIGQTKKVMVYRLVAKDTIEEKVVALKAAKAALFGSVMASDELSSGALTAADIRGLLD